MGQVAVSRVGWAVGLGDVTVEVEGLAYNVLHWHPSPLSGIRIALPSTRVSEIGLHTFLSFDNYG